MKNYKKKKHLNKKNISITKRGYCIPSRDEFHRYYCGELTIDDFSTFAPAKDVSGRIDKAIKWSRSSRYERRVNIDNLNGEASIGSFKETGGCSCTESRFFGFWDEGYQTLLHVFAVEDREGYEYGAK